MWTKRETTTLWAVNGTKIPQYGSSIPKIKHQDSPTIQAKFHVCENDTAIMGLRPCIQLGLVQIYCSVTKRETRKIENIDDLTNDKFHETGNLPEKQKEIHLKETTTPVVQPQRKYPVHLKEEVKKELHKKWKTGVSERVCSERFSSKLQLLL